MIRVGIMATAFNLVDYRTVEPVRRPRLRIVEPTAAGAAVAPVQAPVIEPTVVVRAEKSSTPEHKPMPPSWMIAPPFGSEQIVSVNEPQAAYRPAPAAPVEGPYRNIREVPRA
jgi:hypothetical protein